jgi:hypothetical protein
VAIKSLGLFSGNANRELAEAIAHGLGIKLGAARLSRFSDGEMFCQIEENVRGVHSYVIQPTCSPVNDNLIELLIMVDALRRASAGSITAVLPYYGYARQDRKMAPPHAHQLASGGRSAADRGRQPRPVRGPACRANSRLFQRPLRPPVRPSGVPRGLPEDLV